ncbi:MAG: tRNA lysidine(34) synthetase TilS [Ignavibacteriales bacterium]|nr:tRNA lysidine(34) synthetase TilS [Ignavibacteriales bacterium]
MAEGSFLHAMKSFVRQRELFEHGGTIIMAVSGGVDSMVMLHAVCALQKEWKLTLAVAHFNHQLRGKESEEDESFVRSCARERGLECYIERTDTAAVAEAKKLSVQEAARELRYAFFNKLRTSLGFDRVATAHHADDNAETILFNLIRGAGVHGLAGIQALRNDLSVIRPLLFATREDIEQYATSHSVRYREDSTNAKADYTRNFLRQTLIPLIRENINPNLTATLNRNSDLLTQLDRYVEEESRKILEEVIDQRSKNTIVVNLIRLHAQPVFLQQYVLLHLGRQFASTEIDFSTVRVMLNISHAETGSSCSITKDVSVYRDREYLKLVRTHSQPQFRYHVEPNKTYQFERFVFASSTVSDVTFSDNPHIEYIDADRVARELIIRTWHEGDWFIPLGMHEKKKLSDFFVDQKIPLVEKRTIPIVVSNNDIVWVCGKRLDDRYKITAHTHNILKLEYAPR